MLATACPNGFMYLSEDGQSISLSIKTRMSKPCILFCFRYNLLSGLNFFLRLGGGGVGMGEKERLIHLHVLHESLRYLSTFVLLCQILPGIQAVCNEGSYYRGVFIYFTGKQ